MKVAKVVMNPCVNFYDSKPYCFWRWMIVIPCAIYGVAVGIYDW